MKELKAIKLNEIYDKNLTFLFGSRASFGLFPTLSLAINEKKETFETIATKFEGKESVITLLFMHYYKTCIYPIARKTQNPTFSVSEQRIIQNYEKFLKTTVS